MSAGEQLKSWKDSTEERGGKKEETSDAAVPCNWDCSSFTKTNGRSAARSGRRPTRGLCEVLVFTAIAKSEVPAVGMYLELEDLIRQLGNGIDLVVSEFLSDLGHGSDHRRRSAKQDLDVRSGFGEVFLDHVRANKANTASPALWRGVQNIVNLELRVLLGQQIELGLQDDILPSDIGEDQANLSLVLWVFDNSADDLFPPITHNA